MKPVLHSVWGLTALVSLAVAAAAADGPNDGSAAWQRGSAAQIPAARELLGTYPGLRVYEENGQVRAFYGKPMNFGASAESAASDWLAAHASAFGVPNVEFEQLFTSELGGGRMTVFGYRQTIDSIPVENSRARLLVNHDIGGAVVYVGARLANAAAGQRAALSGDAAVEAVVLSDEYGHLSVWSAPTQVYYAGEDLESAATLAWKFVGENTALEARERYTFFVDAASGRLLAARNEVLNVDVVGQVDGMATPGTLPDKGSNPPTQQPLAQIRVAITGGNNAYTNLSGAYTISHGGTSSVTVTTNLDNGLWVDVNNTAGSVLSLSQNVTPPGPANFLYNPTPSELNTSQVNAFIHTTLIHNFFADRATNFPGGNYKMPANVNINSTCNAYFDGPSINFYRAGGGCANTAYSSVVAHEYGHYVVQSLGLAQGSFGEGYGDTCSIVLYDDPIIGRDFCGTGCYVRYPDLDQVQYPCGGEIHYCGEALAGAWWDIRVNLGNLAAAQQLMVDWSLITNGGSGNNGAHPQTAIEVLTVDDDNGDIGDGTPNYGQICNAFGQYNIDCPPLDLLTFSYPDGLPTELEPDTATTFRVNVSANSANPQPGTGMLSYRIGGVGGYTTVAMGTLGTNQYEATLPPVDCGSKIEFYVSAQTTGGATATDPSDAPATVFSALSAEDILVPFSDAFETDLGWTVGDTGDNATTGVWTRTDPTATAAQPGDDHTSAGTICWVTDGRGGALGDYDVDNGKTTLKSPIIDLSGAANATISYWRWYSNNTGASPYADTFVVDISNNGGTTWVNAETVGPSGPEVEGGWYYHEIDVASKVALTAQIRLRFIAQDQGSGSLVEAAIDDFVVSVIDCSTPDCPGDLNGDSTVDLGDLSILLANFGGSGSAEDGDLNGDGTVDLTDLSEMLVYFGTTC